MSAAPYLEPTDHGATTGWAKTAHRSKSLPYECPRCHGYGGWNLSLDAYGLGEHFRTVCWQCTGYGYVSEKDVWCVHDFRNLGTAEVRARFSHLSGRRCWNVYQCRTCGRVRGVDSSD